MPRDISPRDMIRFGRYERLRRFVNEALAENAVADRALRASHATSAADTAS